MAYSHNGCIQHFECAHVMFKKKSKTDDCNLPKN